MTIYNSIRNSMAADPHSVGRLFFALSTSVQLAFMQEMMSTSNGTTIHVPFDAAMQDMMKNETLLSIITRRSGQKAREQLAQINHLLNAIPK